MINWNNAQFFKYPFPYIVIDDCFDDEVFEKLNNEWPYVQNTGTVMGGRKQITHKSPWLSGTVYWKQFYNYLNQDSELQKFKDIFQPEIKEWEGVVDDQYQISNKQMYLHIDWSEAVDGYVREIHTDSSKRFTNFLIFFNDKDWQGGDFVIHSSDNITSFHPPKAGYQEMYNHKQAPVYTTVEAKANRCIFFLSSPNSLHSVDLQKNTKSKRRFIYGAYSIANPEVKAFGRYTRETT